MMQTAEAIVLGQTQKGGAASVMQSTVTFDERANIVSHSEVTDITSLQGVTATETGFLRRRIITESVGGQIVRKFLAPAPIPAAGDFLASTLECGDITIGEALEATVISASGKPVDQGDAATIQASKVRATYSDIITPRGIAATEQSTTSVNERISREEAKTKLANMLANVTVKLEVDKVVTKEDAKGEIGAELRNNPNISTYPGGVAESMVAAVRINICSKRLIIRKGIQKEVPELLLEYGLERVVETLIECLSRVKKYMDEGRTLVSLDLQRCLCVGNNFR